MVRRMCLVSVSEPVAPRWCMGKRIPPGRRRHRRPVEFPWCAGSACDRPTANPEGNDQRIVGNERQKPPSRGTDCQPLADRLRGVAVGMPAHGGYDVSADI